MHRSGIDASGLRVIDMAVEAEGMTFPGTAKWTNLAHLHDQVL
jgi:hypothetical protein